MSTRAKWAGLAVCAGCVALVAANILNDSAKFSPGQSTAHNPLAPSGLLPPPGGETTLPRQSSRTFIYPAANMDNVRELDFWTGFALFRDPWVIAPSSTTARDGLGPLYNARSCETCHRSGGRSDIDHGRSPPISVVVQLGVGGNGGTLEPHGTYGSQLQSNAIPGALGPDAVEPETFGAGEASLSIRWQAIRGTFADGTSYELLSPTYEVDQLRSGALQGDVQLSARVAPPLPGLGLLEAIPAEDILDRADPDDRDGDGISGHANLVPHPVTGVPTLGRFGWKATQPTLATQVALAFREDIGITSGIFPDESCTEGQEACRKLRTGADAPDYVEIGDDLFGYVVDFVASIALPPAGESTPEVRFGSELFRESGCNGCHRPGYTTGESAHGEHLARQVIRPYTDLLLHDMGEGLADRTADGRPGNTEWRTPPLWGLGLARHITGSESYLHDGRARTIAEAVLWHGGEAAKSREAFRSMDQSQRAALEAFVRAL